jgi:hypothetical protein
MAWCDGVPTKLRNLTTAIEASGEPTVERLSSADRFPAIGYEPFNLSPDEIASEWGRL